MARRPGTLRAVALAVADLVFTRTRLHYCRFRFEKKEEASQQELEALISHKDEYKSEEHYSDGTGHDTWTGSLYSSKYRSVAICCADPYNDEAREVRCAHGPTIKPESTTVVLVGLNVTVRGRRETLFRSEF